MDNFIRWLALPKLWKSEMTQADKFYPLDSDLSPGEELPAFWTTGSSVQQIIFCSNVMKLVWVCEVISTVLY